MELLVITTLLLGLWMNLSFAFRSKPRWAKLHALRKLVEFQLTTDLINIAIHLVLLIPWPFWGYAVNPRNFLWTINPVACRIITAVEDLISVSCAANATGILVTDLEKQELRREKKRKLAFCLVLLTFCLGGVCSVVYTELIPLVASGTLSGSNCPSHSFLLLCAQNDIKFAFASYTICSVILFWSAHHTSTSNLSESAESRARNIITSLSRCLSLAHQSITVSALVFAATYILIFFFGGSLYSVVFNKVKLYFDITVLAVSIGVPVLLAQIHDGDNNGVGAYPLASSFGKTSTGTGQRH